MAHTSRSRRTPASRREATVGLHGFALAVVVCSMPFWWLGHAAERGLPVGLPASALMVVVPAIVATFLVARSRGLVGVRELLLRLRPTVDPGTRGWWIASALTMPLLLGIALGIQAAEGRFDGQALGLGPRRVALAFVVFAVAAAIEEIGWTAYATDVARSRWTDLRAGLVIGATWAAWHVIPWFQAGHSVAWVVAQSAFTVLLRVLIVAVYRNTGRQVFSAVLLHATANLGLIPADGRLYDPYLMTVLLAPVVLLALSTGPLRPRPCRGAAPRSRLGIAIWVAASAALMPHTDLDGQAVPSGPRGWQLAGIPALNYDADEGAGYGAALSLYDYGAGAPKPYRMTVQPSVFLTTEGRRDVVLFLDLPALFASRWRLDAFLSSERHLATPYYGQGNDTAYDPLLESGESPHYYRFGRTRWRAAVNLQWTLGSSSFRLLIGAGVKHTSIVTVPEGGTTTLLSQSHGGSEVPEGWLNHVRAGVVHDTRDRESGPTRGSWSELLVQRVSEALGSFADYTRWAVADRRYVSLAGRLVFAHRVILQGVTDGAPFHDLSVIQASFGQHEGIGGARSIRGLPQNRFIGRGMLLWNAELRWRARDFGLFGRSSHLVLSGFLDSGRVWRDGVDLARVTADLHHGVGGGVRLGIGEDFVVALDIGRSGAWGPATYIGLGYLY